MCQCVPYVFHMAYLVKRGGVYYLSHCANPERKRERISLGLRVDIGQDVRKAKEIEAEHTHRERQAGATIGPRFRSEEHWDSWVPEYMRQRYRNKPGTYRRWESMWRTLRLYLEEKGVKTPRQLTRQHCFDYFAWRVVTDAKQIEADKKRGKFKAVHNTAHLELSNLRKIMKEAVLRRFAPYNPALELGIGLDEKQKPCEFTDDMLAKLEAYILEQPEPDKTILWRSFMVARYHGVRLMETNVNPAADFDPVALTVNFYQKGGRKRTKPLHPALVPMFQELHASGATELFKFPGNFASYWFAHMERSGMKAIHPKACFHSLRVTVQNKLRRAGIHDEIRRAYLSHEKQGDVHEGYSRIKTDELKVCHAAL
jgi:hypothetical protein